jgi:hypothetical protein
LKGPWKKDYSRKRKRKTKIKMKIRDSRDNNLLGDRDPVTASPPSA